MAKELLVLLDKTSSEALKELKILPTVWVLKLKTDFFFISGHYRVEITHSTDMVMI